MENLVKIPLGAGYAKCLSFCPRYIGREWTRISLEGAKFINGSPDVSLIAAENANEYLVKNMVKLIDLGDGKEIELTDSVLDALPDHLYLKLAEEVTKIKVQNLDAKKK